jgi:lysophospholipase L1-like esterase
MMNLRLSIFVLVALSSFDTAAREMQAKPADSFFAKYQGYAAPQPSALVLKEGDRLAICGDSITEQKMYSVLMETYLVACLPELEITCRQYGWGGEQAAGFLKRMKNDVLRFAPTVATTCYGMNDHQYVPYTAAIGDAYRTNQSAIIQTFKEAGVRVVTGSPGCIHTVPGWVKSAAGSWEDLNLSLLQLRNIDIELAEATGTGFADVFWPMLTAGHAARAQFGEANFKIEGGDGVHPGWAGQVVMASAFLKGLGCSGDLGTITLDAAAGRATATGGHTVTSATAGEVKVTSRQLAFSPPPGELNKDDSIRAGMALCGFDAALNRFTFKATGLTAASYKLTWGEDSRTLSAADLTAGVNLAAIFATSPFTDRFGKIQAKVAAKQAYETRQIKEIFHGPEGRTDLEAAATVTEKVRAPLAAAVAESIQPVAHVITLQPAS